MGDSVPVGVSLEVKLHRCQPIAINIVGRECLLPTEYVRQRDTEYGVDPGRLPVGKRFANLSPGPKSRH